MYLFFDLTEQDTIVVHVCVGDTWTKIDFPYEAEDALLSGITRLLNERDKKLTDISGIGVRVGLGRFTATRVSVTVANTLGYALQIPVTAYTNESLEEVKQRVIATPVGQYAHAQYSAPASVGKKIV